MSDVKIGRPREGKQVKKNYGVKLEPSQYAEIVREYGSFTKWVKLRIEKDKKLKNPRPKT